MIESRVITNRKFQLDALDGLRGLAVLFVFFSHTSHAGVYMLPYMDFTGVGKNGVFLFFMLSSFLLSYPFIEKASDALSKRYFINYFFRRFMRVYPLYFVYLSVGVVSTIIFSRYFNFEKEVGIPFSLTAFEYLQHLLLSVGKGVTWSIIVEFRYYFILPFIALTYSIILKNNLVYCTILTISIMTISLYVWPQSEAVVNDPRVTSYLTVFIGGTYLSLLHYRWQNSAMVRSIKLKRVLEFSGILSFLIIISLTPSILSVIVAETLPYNIMHKEFLLFSFLWGVVLFASINGYGLLKSLFEISFLRYIGLISFSFYLIHLVVVSAITRTSIPLEFQGVTILSITILFSHASYLLFERPASLIKLNYK